MSYVSRSLVVAGALTLAACAAMQQQHSQPVRADQGEFKNLKVLPQNITHDELLATMRGFTRALGVRCNHCHVAIPGEENKFEFPSDAKKEKNIARQMILMTRSINSGAIPKVRTIAGLEEKVNDVTCFTCHRGKVHPESAAPPREGQS